MASLFSKALVYLGLVDEDQYEGDTADRPTGPPPDEPRARRVEPRPMPEGRRVEPPAATRLASRPQPRMREETPAPETGRVGLVRPVEVQSDILLVEEFGDAKVLADRVRDKVPVVLNLRDADPDLVRRVVDFSSGLIYALDGTMRKVGEGLVLVLPPRVTLSRDEKRRLASLGAYELDDFHD